MRCRYDRLSRPSRSARTEPKPAGTRRPARLRAGLLAEDGPFGRANRPVGSLPTGACRQWRPTDHKRPSQRRVRGGFSPPSQRRADARRASQPPEGTRYIHRIACLRNQADRNRQVVKATPPEHPQKKESERREVVGENLASTLASPVLPSISVPRRIARNRRRNEGRNVARIARRTRVRHAKIAHDTPAAF